VKRKKNLRIIRNRTGEADLVAEAEATAGVDLIAGAAMIAVDESSPYIKRITM